MLYVIFCVFAKETLAETDRGRDGERKKGRQYYRIFG
jgi:hypothetical protein